MLKEAGLAMDRFGSRMTNDVAYMQELSRHRQTLPLYDIVPQIDQAWVAPNASLVGEVIVSKYATVWYNVVIRAELNPVRIGHFSSIGDGTSINTACALPHGVASSVNIGKNVTVEAHCSLYSCIIDDDVLIAHTWNGQPLSIEHGGPARVIVPKRYAWKGAKWIREITFLDRDILGFWEVRGYSNSADPWTEDRFS